MSAALFALGMGVAVGAIATGSFHAAEPKGINEIDVAVFLAGVALCIFAAVLK